MEHRFFSRRVVGLIAVAAIFGGSTVTAHEVASEPAISSRDALKLARNYLTSIGYTRPGTSTNTASVGKVEMIEGTWVVNVRTGARYPREKGVVLIDIMDGAIKETFN